MRMSIRLPSTMGKPNLRVSAPSAIIFIPVNSIPFLDILQQHLSALQSFIPPMSLQVINILTRRCNIALLEMRSIPSRIRAISNKRLPSEPSPFVEQTLKPVKVFFGVGVGEGPATGLKDQLLGPFGEEIFENVCQR